ncbi:MAG: DegV family EDD domain-containing protein [Lachnospiraceae bacterium]|nr:DegV family EDD domain-containing protein [Lachnospiraceae bacterium]
MKNKVRISVDCICDLPRKMWDELNLSIMYFYITTEEGRFQDIRELNSDCIIEYLEQGKVAKSGAASVEEYKEHFQKVKKKHGGAIIHISVAQYVSGAYKAATKAAECMEDVYVVDSGQLSGGMSLMILEAAEMAAAGADYELILNEMEVMKKKINTSFIVDSTKYLYRNGQIKKVVMNLCNMFSLHPILRLSNSHMGVSGICMGNSKRCAKAYIKKILKKPETIDTDVVFVVSAGCSYEFINFVKEEIQKRAKWQKIIINTASATITSNCGSGTFGVLFARK